MLNLAFMINWLIGLVVNQPINNDYDENDDDDNDDDDAT